MQDPEVLYSSEPITILNGSDLEFLKKRSVQNARSRVRLCVHLDKNNVLHEMIIVHGREAYVRPHKHLHKSESMHIIEGEVDVIVFDDNAEIEAVIEMGEHSSGKDFYYRMATPKYHMLIIRSEILVFHETTNGPFDPSAVVFAPWAPSAAEAEGVAIFLTKIETTVKAFKSEIMRGSKS